MIIKRTLLKGEWSYDDATDQVGVKVVGQSEITLNKTYAYSLARFLLRVFQRQSSKHRKEIAPEEPRD